jgi:hypothetical protein
VAAAWQRDAQVFHDGLRFFPWALAQASSAAANMRDFQEGWRMMSVLEMLLF